MKKFLLLIICLVAFPVSAKHLYREAYYNTKWCSANNGIKEYTTEDGSRVDCLLNDYAVEAEFANKWKEAVGQSLFYGMQTNRQAGILLIIENPISEQKYLNRLNLVANKYNIKIWVIKPTK